MRWPWTRPDTEPARAAQAAAAAALAHAQAQRPRVLEVARVARVLARQVDAAIGDIERALHLP